MNHEKSSGRGYAQTFLRKKKSCSPDELPGDSIMLIVVYACSFHYLFFFFEVVENKEEVVITKVVTLRRCKISGSDQSGPKLLACVISALRNRSTESKCMSSGMQDTATVLDNDDDINYS